MTSVTLCHVTWLVPMYYNDDRVNTVNVKALRVKRGAKKQFSLVTGLVGKGWYKRLRGRGHM